MKNSAFTAGSLLPATVAILSVAHSDEAATSDDAAFKLGEIVVAALQHREPGAGGNTPASEAIHTFQRDSLGQAAQPIPGDTAGMSGGWENFVREPRGSLLKLKA